MREGKFVISLDYELMWGVRDKKTVFSYGKSIVSGKSALISTIELLERYGCNATVATVGLLFLKNKNDIISNIPNELPTYVDTNLSPYRFIIEELKESGNFDSAYFGYELTKRLQQYSNVEIATHTFSHYYCLEKGQTIFQYEQDLQKAISVAKREGSNIRSIVFPRNQFNNSYLRSSKNAGINSYRGNPNHRIYRSSSGNEESLLKRLLRLLDTYINLTGHHCYDLKINNEELPLNIPGSRFLKPYSSSLKQFDPLKLNRIKKSMTFAAKNNKIYHLWWHPHNFGNQPEKNLEFLKKILQHYIFLKEKYSFSCQSMNEIYEQTLSK